MFRLARSRALRAIVGWMFAYMSSIIPVKRLIETNTLIAFYHPDPSSPTHILLVPKSAIGSLADLGEEHQDFLRDLFRTVQRLVVDLDLEQAGYRLIANGGSYQEIPQLHFHLISEKPRQY